MPSATGRRRDAKAGWRPLSDIRRDEFNAAKLSLALPTIRPMGTGRPSVQLTWTWELVDVEKPEPKHALTRRIARAKVFGLALSIPAAGGVSRRRSPRRCQ